MLGTAAPNSTGMLLLLLSLLAGMQKHSHANIMMLLGFTSCMLSFICATLLHAAWNLLLLDELLHGPLRHTFVMMYW